MNYLIMLLISLTLNNPKIDYEIQTITNIEGTKYIATTGNWTLDKKPNIKVGDKVFILFEVNDPEDSADDTDILWFKCEK